jgi:hypothetical protein
MMFRNRDILYTECEGTTGGPRLLEYNRLLLIPEPSKGLKPLQQNHILLADKGSNQVGFYPAFYAAELA